MHSALSLKDVTKQFGFQTSVDQVTFDVKVGSIVALLGPNGAGKSTTMKMSAGFIAPDDGVVSVLGKDIRIDPVSARLATTFLPESVVLYEELTGRENLRHLLAIGSSIKRSQDELGSALQMAGLQKDAFDRSAATYSKGMRQKVGLALALSRQSELLLLDEPTSGLDPRSAAEFNEALRKTAAKGVGVLMATHDIWRAREVATDILIMANGKIVLQLDPASLSAEEIEERFFLETGVHRDVPAKNNKDFLSH